MPFAIKVSPPPPKGGRYNRIPGVREPKFSRQSTTDNYFPLVNESRRSRRDSSGPGNEQIKEWHTVLKSGPFESIMVPCDSAKAVAGYLLRNLISTVIITHPHLDHLSGFAINTAGLQSTTRPKKIVALPGTIDAIKSHIFNDVIWPNMSDEEGGIGFITYQRLVEGGHGALGEDEGLGYIEVCDGLAVKAWTVSHGHCVKRHTHRGSGSLESGAHFGTLQERGRMSRASNHSLPGTAHSNNPFSPIGDTTTMSQTNQISQSQCVIDSSAFFIRDEETGQEILVFGDVEPDSISIDPRTARVWADAAPKIASGTLTAIFIECSYDDSQSDATLFGHLAPRHLVAELAVLAAKVITARSERSVHFEYSVAAATPNTALAANIPLPRSDSPTSHKKRKRLEPDSPTPTPSKSDESTGSVTRSSGRTKRPGSQTNATTKRPVPRRMVSGISPMSSPTVDLYDHRGARSPLASADNEPPLTLRTSSAQNGVPSSVEQATLAVHATMLSNGLEGPVGLERNSSAEDLVDIRGQRRRSSTLRKRPLEGVKIIIIHVKDPLRDGLDQKDVIVRQCQERERSLGLGCEFLACARGDSIWI